MPNLSDGRETATEQLHLMCYKEENRYIDFPQIDIAVSILLNILLLLFSNTLFFQYCLIFSFFKCRIKRMLWATADVDIGR